MDAKEIVDTLSDDDIFQILLDLDANPQMTNNAIICRTICHGGDSEKLYYYFDTKVWKCFTHSCRIGNIFNLIMLAKDCEFIEAYRYVCDKFNLSTDKITEEQLDFSFFKKFKINNELEKYKPLNKQILNNFFPYYYEDWINEGITIEAMKKFNILFNLEYFRIAIPHYDVQGNLIGIRRRNLLQEEVTRGKYQPEYIGRQQYNHSLGGNIYGLNVTKEQILSSKSIILFEAEKSVLQLYSFGIGLGGGALCGSSLTTGHLNLLIRFINEYDVEEVIIAMDKEFLEVGDALEDFQQRKIRMNMIDKLLPYVGVSVIWDTENLLGYKDSPTDKGVEVFQKLLNNRIIIND